MALGWSEQHLVVHRNRRLHSPFITTCGYLGYYQYHRSPSSRLRPTLPQVAPLPTPLRPYKVNQTLSLAPRPSPVSPSPSSSPPLVLQHLPSQPTIAHAILAPAIHGRNLTAPIPMMHHLGTHTPALLPLRTCPQHPDIERLYTPLLLRQSLHDELRRAPVHGVRDCAERC